VERPVGSLLLPASWKESTIVDDQQRQTERENELIVALCHEAGDVGSDAELIEGFRSNYHPDVIAAAARGDVDAIVELRRGCGLPIFS
jgi:hypothetical protein